MDQDGIFIPASYGIVKQWTSVIGIMTGLLLFFACKNPAPDSLLHDGKTIELVSSDSLYMMGKRYLANGNDSVKAIADQIIRMGKSSEDTLVWIKGILLKANTAWKNSNYKEAMSQSLIALSMAQKKGLNDEVFRIYGIIGHLYKENENYPSAIPMAQKALAVAKANGDTGQIISAILNLGMFTHSYGMQKKDTAYQARALPLYLEGLKLAESSSRFMLDRIPFYDDLSQYYKMKGDYKKGIYYGKKGMNLALQYNRKSSLTYSYNWLGEMYFYQGDHRKGLAYLNKALQAARDIGNAFREAEIYGSFYACYHSINDDKNALQYFYRGMEIRDSLQVEQNVKDIGQLHIQYETGKKDAEIAALDVLNKERAKRNLYILIGLILFVALSVFLFFQGKRIRNKNKLLIRKNNTIEEQSDQLKLLMKELHHRVKNNLQIVSSLLSLQSNHLPDKDARQAVRIGQQRIEAMSLIHRSLYQQENPNMVNMKEYVSDLVSSILRSFGINEQEFDLELVVDVEEMDVDLALPLGLIINEWVTNSFKYAYTGITDPVLSISLAGKNGIDLKIKDNGPGMNREAWEKPKGSFGIKLVKVLSKQLDASCAMRNDNGTELDLHIPLVRKKAG